MAPPTSMRPAALSVGSNPAATADNHILLAGSFDQYLAVRRVGTTIEFVPHLFGPDGRPTGQRGYYLYTRVGGGVLVPEAFRLLNVATTA